MESHHGILEYEELWIFRLQRQFHFLSKQESGICNPVPHLREVFNRHVSNGVSVSLARTIEIRENALPVWAVPVDEFHEISAIFETAIQPLSEERNNCMCRIA